MGTILLIILILLLIGALPAWPYSSGGGYPAKRRLGTCKQQGKLPVR
jgi:hypothetical protein